MHKQHPGTVWNGQEWISYADAVQACPPDDWEDLLQALTEAIIDGDIAAVAPRRELLDKMQQ